MSTQAEHAEKGVAVVLAGTRGIGRACVEALADAGHLVVFCGRSQDGIDRLVSEIEARGCSAEGLVADVSDAAATEAVIAHALESQGRLDVLVANAGGPPPGGFNEVSDEDWEAAFRLTLMSVVTSTRAVLPQMQRQGRGRIVVIGSSSVRMPLAGLTLSNVFRPALDGLVKSLAVEVARSGITANMVCPGKIDTDRVRELDEIRARAGGRTNNEQRAVTEAQIPAGHYGKARDVAAAVTFLASDSASYLTGQAILVDGGLVPALP